MTIKSSKSLGSILNKAIPATTSTVTDTKKDNVSFTPKQKEQKVVSPAKSVSDVTREPENPLQIMVPASIKKQIRIRAAEEETTERAIVLRALKKIGFNIPDDIVDDRRGRR